ncbi:MAG: mechanosensitive ion channel [Acidobacteriota bacterium]|nr:mechanosensitive ion channel [Acidobacteriota bacterium]MDH3785626.1 mechanosensitive ion channel [Acidobacteriota bacterium]
MNEYMTDLWQSLIGTLGDSLPRILAALAILVGGWLVAVVIRAIIRRGLGMLKINERVKSQTGNELEIQNGVASGAFYIVILMTMAAFFNTLQLTLVSEPLQSLAGKIIDFLPNLIAAGVLIVVAWIIATILRRLATTALASTKLDEKLSDEAGMRPMSANIGNVLYGLVLLLFLPAILGTLALGGLLEPIQSMLDKMLLMVPNIIAAAVLGVVGWFVAKLLRSLMTNLLAAVGVDKLGASAGLSGSMTLSRLCGLIVFIFVFVPALIAALNALKIEAISRPATEMLGTFMSAIPNLFGAAIILGIAFFVSRLIGSLITSLLAGVGFDRLPGAIGLGNLFPESNPASRIAGRVVVFFFMLFAVVESATMLGFTAVSDLVAMFIEFGSEVLLGVAIITIGLWLSNIAHGAISRMQRANAGFMAGLARFAILGIVFAMGLRAMGIADDIVNLAFALTLGSIAVAVALSFGLGGREAAGKTMEHWLSRFR